MNELDRREAANDLKDRLTRYRQDQTHRYTGRKTGRTISIPVWFVQGDKLYLLPPRARLGHPMVPERISEPVDSD
jgi:hypothetical protein